MRRAELWRLAAAVSTPLLALWWAGCGSETVPTPPTCSQAEICNGEDDDCDGAIDEGVLGFYHPDGDGDGFGDYQSEAQCQAPDGYVNTGGDCNDNDGDIHPDAAEQCDAIDQDCDAVIDEGAQLTFFEDSDGDGFGGVVTINACEAPSGFVELGGDCNDDSVAVSPGSDESCNNTDDDCDGAVDESESDDSAWAFSLCAAELEPETSLTPGIDVQTWPSSGPRLYEEEQEQGGNDTLATAQALNILGTPTTILGQLLSSGSSGATYTGDLDNFSFIAPSGGTLTIAVAGASADGVEVLLYDSRTQVYEGPVAAPSSLVREVTAGAPYTLTVASVGDSPTTYQITLTITGDDATRAAHTLWYSASRVRDGDYLGSAASANGLSWRASSESVVADDCGPATTGLRHPSVLVTGGRYHLFFSAYGDEGPAWIGRATSYDGVSFTCDDAAVLTAEDTGLPGGLAYPSVRLGPDGTWWMWYGEISDCVDDPCPVESLGVATSSNGEAWVVKKSGILPADGRPSWASGELLGHQVIRGPTGWQMYISVGNSRSSASIGEALSGDGLSWLLGSEPILEPGSGAALDPSRLLSPAATLSSTEEGPTRLWYLGEQPLTRLGMAWKAGEP